jgi:hypothetical protein
MRGDKKKMRSEANVMNDCLLALSQAGCLAWRNNTGQLPDANARSIKFGLCVGSSDIIGVAPDGRFLAVECKTAIGQPTDAQVRFLDAVRSKGGRAGIARCADDAVKIALDDG